MEVKHENGKFHSQLEMRLNRYDSLSLSVHDSGPWLTVVCSSVLYVLIPFGLMPFEQSKHTTSYLGRQINFRVYRTSLDQFYSWLSSVLSWNTTWINNDK